MDVVHAWGMTEMSPLGSVAVPPAEAEGEERWAYRQSQGRLSPLVQGRLVGPDGSTVGVGRRAGRRAGGPRPVDHRLVLPGRRPGEVRRRLAAHRGRRVADPRRVPAADRPGQGRHQVRRRVDLLGRPGERADGAPEGARGQRGRRPGRAVGRAPAGHRRRRRGRGGRRSRSCATTCPSTSPSGSCPSGGRSSPRCPRPASASSTRRCCASPTPRASSRSARSEARPAGSADRRTGPARPCCPMRRCGRRRRRVVACSSWSTSAVDVDAGVLGFFGFSAFCTYSRIAGKSGCTVLMTLLVSGRR